MAGELSGEEVLQKVYGSTARYIGIRPTVAYHDTQLALMMIQKNYPYTVHPFGRGNLSSDGVVYSAEVNASATATTVTVLTSTIEAPGIDETIDEVEFGLTAAFKALKDTSTAPTATTLTWYWEAKNSTATAWTVISTARKFGSTTYADRTQSGRFATVTNFNSLPFNIRLRMKCSAGAANRGRAKIKNSSYVTVKCKKS